MAEDRLMVSVSGVRGTIGGTLTPTVLFDFGATYGTMLGAGSTVAMGRDSRPSGDLVRCAVSAGLMSAGVSVIDLGIVTTPGAALMTSRLGCQGGIVITASHNPHPYNGIKFLQPTGVALPAETAAQLKATWQAGQFHQADALAVGRLTQNDTTHDTHVQAVCETLDEDTIRRNPVKVVLDSINGAGCTATPMLLERLGCEVIHINGTPNGQFAHTPEPTEQNLTGLADAVRQNGAQIGFAQDPDADRLALVDETGRYIGEEYTLALCAAFVLRHRKGTLAANLSTSRMIDDLAAAAGVEVVRSPTGESNVVHAMWDNDCIFGGEGNGGVIDPRIVPVRDSLVGMGMILQLLAETGKPLSQLAAEIPLYELIKTKMACPAGAAEKVIAQAKQTFAAEPDATFNEEDGLRIDFADRWVSVRASNTEPIMRIFAEAPTADAAQNLVSKMQQIAETVL